MASNEPESDDREEFPVLYSQQVLVGSSFYDFSLVFLQESYRGSRPVANVALPPATAKHLVQLLADAVAAWEEANGEIALPPADPVEMEA